MEFDWQCDRAMLVFLPSTEGFDWGFDCAFDWKFDCAFDWEVDWEWWKHDCATMC